ncbi:MAG: tetraacyldisaccharide 4'-kinase [Paracoccaceae bacterium]|nr:tetraacyldisaccharide 4'-kinase [Paracoccaceae bacterium]
MRPPVFWFRPPAAPGPLSAALLPLSGLWAAAVRWRLRRGQRGRIGVPVICVGNIGIGGSGKTPTVIELVSRLTASGHCPHVLARGYGGSLSGPLRVEPGRHASDEVGDEPLLHAAFTPTWIARDRLAGGQAAAAAGAGLVVLDDGFQNASLAHDLSILVVNAAAAFGNGCVIPAGPLREPVGAALARADLVLSVGSDPDHDRLTADWPQLRRLPVLRASLEALPTGMDWSGQRVYAFAGIGHPSGFFAMLRALGAEVVGSRIFADHQAFPPRVLRRLEAAASNLDAQLVTTEKDAVRLPEAFRQRVLTLPVRLVVHDDARLRDALAAIVAPGG